MFSDQDTEQLPCSGARRLRPAEIAAAWRVTPRWVTLRARRKVDVLLAFNEPEWASQANMTPAVAAKTLRYLESVWPGELYCCGNIITHAGWPDRMMAAYKAA